MDSTADDKKTPYRVLARKYRSQSFAELIGQDALVRTLTNAIESGRIAQAYMLTGIRGVGKTSTARLIAKALNYSKGPTAGPTDDCPICKAITEDRHPDILEMDAASRTGVDDIRELIDSVRYAPSEARYKVYIIDEVHMLSKPAFNALLKTLEEPPPRVIFIFATTEIRKVPITILSRCQRFDLRRIDQDTLAAHYTKIAALENVTIEDSAVQMIARAADGSVRDGLSLLDQAIAMSEDDITAAQIQDMLGLADQARITDILEHLLTGNIQAALAANDDMYKSGAQASIVAEDLLEQIHLLTRIRAVPGDTTLQKANPETAKRLEDMAGSLSMPTLARSWQILLKGLSDIQYAPNPQDALEMVLIRLSYTADLPDPADLLKKLKDQPVTGGGMHSVPPATPPTSTGTLQKSAASHDTYDDMRPTTMALAPAPQPMTATAPHKLEDIIALLEQNGKFQLASQMTQYVQLVRLENLQLEFSLAPQAPSTLPHELTQSLRALTGQRWLVVLSTEPGAETLAAQRLAARQSEIDHAKADPLISEILEIFPDAAIERIYDKDE